HLGAEGVRDIQDEADYLAAGVDKAEGWVGALGADAQVLRSESLGTDDQGCSSGQQNLLIAFHAGVAPLTMAGHELFTARRMRVVKYLRGRSLLLDQTLVEENHFAGDLLGEIHLMGDQQHGAPLFGERANYC